MRTELLESFRRDDVMTDAASVAERMLSEAAASIEDRDQANWSMIASAGGATVGGVEKDQDVNKANTARKQAYNMYYTSPYVRGIIRTLGKFVFGKGVTVDLLEEKEGKKKKAMDYLEEWRARNHWELAQKEMSTRSFRDGENFFYNRKMGNKKYPRLEFIEPDAVQSQDPKFPHGIEMVSGDPTTVRWYHVTVDKKETKVPGKDVVHIKMNVDRNVYRGRTCLEPIFRHLALHDDWLDTRMVLNKVRSAVAIVRTVEGKQVQGQVIRKANADPRSNRPQKARAFKSGTILTAGPGVKYEMLSANLGASDAANDGRNILLAIAVGVGFPEMFLTSDFSNANFASTAIAQNPFVREFEDWQDFFDVYLQDEFRRVLELGVEAELVDKDTSLKMKLTFPPLIHKDFVSNVTALGQLYMNEVISKSTFAAESGFVYDEEKEKRDEEDLEKAAEDFAYQGDPVDGEEQATEADIVPVGEINEAVLEKVRRSLQQSLHEEYPDWTVEKIAEVVEEGTAEYIKETTVKQHQARSKKGKIFNVRQHEREVTNNPKEWAKGLDEKQMESLLLHTSDPELNLYLRGEYKADELDITDLDNANPKVMTKNIDSAVARYELPKPVIAYRGMAFDRKPSWLKKGSIIKDKAFSSTSTKHSVAKEMIEEYAQDVSVMVQIKIPKGTKAAPVFALKDNEYRYQAELLLGRGSRFKITKVSEKVYRSYGEDIGRYFSVEAVYVKG